MEWLVAERLSIKDVKSASNSIYFGNFKRFAAKNASKYSKFQPFSFKLPIFDAQNASSCLKIKNTRDFDALFATSFV